MNIWEKTAIFDFYWGFITPYQICIFNQFFTKDLGNFMPTLVFKGFQLRLKNQLNIITMQIKQGREKNGFH